MLLRNGIFTSESETALPFALNDFRERKADGVLGYGQYDEQVDAVERLGALASRLIECSWLGKPVSKNDIRQVNVLLTSLRVRLDAGKINLDRSKGNREAIIARVHKGPEAEPDDLISERHLSEDPEAMRSLLEEGIIDYVLIGMPAVRACLWCSALFQPDRETALFDHVRCRVAFNRALSTAAKNANPRAQLLGTFCCVRCRKYKMIDQASGLRLTRSRPFIAGLSENSHVCVGCAKTHFSAWSRYMAPIIGAV